MIIRNTLRAIALATSCLVPLAAFAADDDFSLAPAPPEAADVSIPPPPGPLPFTGFIQLGIGGLVGNNPGWAGRYTGLNTTGVDAFTKFDLGHRDYWSSGGTRYWDFSGENLNFQTGNHFGNGLDNDGQFSSSVSNLLANNGSLTFRAGDQGTWGLVIYYDAITYTGNPIDSLYSFSGNQGFLNNGLAPWGGATATRAGPVTAFTVPQLNATGAMQPFQTGTRRNIIGGDFKYIWEDWTVAGAIRHEHKEGSMEESFDGPYGGTAFALPINYDTERYDLSATYNTRAWQGVFQYTFSHFTDNLVFVALPYPTSNTAAPFQRSAAYSTAPSNDAHYLTMMLASGNIIPLTRVNVNARIGLELQNDQFAPNTADPSLTAAVPGFSSLNANRQGTSTNSPEMMAEIYQLKISANSHPLPNVDTRVFYGLDGRSVSLNQYQVNVGGTGGLSDSNLSGVAFVVPQDWLKQNAGGEVGYRFIPESDTKVTVGYRFDAIERSNAQVGHSSTNTATVALLSDIGPDVNGKISFEYADRTGALTYLGPWAFLGQTAAFSGAYYQAPMTSEAVVLRADYTPSPMVSGGLFLQFKNENYTYPAATLANGATPATEPLTGVGQGVKQDYTLTVGPDINYRPAPNLNIHLFYTYELLFFNNTGNGACSTAAQAATAACAGTVGNFQNTYNSTTQTIGVSSDWRINEKLRLRAEYTLSYGSVMFGEFNGVFVPNPTASYQNVTNYPDINSLMNNVRLTGTYDVRSNVQLVLQGIFTAFHNNDWNDTANAVQGAGTSAISILTPGYSSPNYSVVALMAGVKVRF
jgi:MtrB/PioB family decaheme-associated outer membrane protein